jgi:hypothetical protein
MNSTNLTRRDKLLIYGSVAAVVALLVLVVRLISGPPLWLVLVAAAIGFAIHAIVMLCGSWFKKGS